jgi:hypothetical protein
MSDKIGLFRLIIMGVLLLAAPVAANACTCSLKKVWSEVGAAADRRPEPLLEQRQHSQRTSFNRRMRSAEHDASLTLIKKHGRVRLTSPIGEVKLKFIRQP